MNKKHFSYGNALRQRGKHQLIVPDFEASFSHNLVDLVRLAFKKSPHKYILENEESGQAIAFRIALHYGYDLNEAKQFYEDKQEEYKKKHYDFLGSRSSGTNNVYCKQYALDELYHTLQKTSIKGVMERK